MRTKLQNIASIQSGITGKKGPRSNAICLQARHFTNDGAFVGTFIPDVYISNSDYRYLLNDGDVLYAAKGAKNFAATYRSELGRAVASSTFAVIRLNASVYNFMSPEYLAWYLNHPATFERLKSKAVGSNVQWISVTELKRLDIDIPDYETQQELIVLSTLTKREQFIRTQIESLRTVLLQYQLLLATKQ